MSLKKENGSGKKQEEKLKEDLTKLDESGLLADKGDMKKESDEKNQPDTKEQQKTGDTSRSDRRL